MQNSDFTGAFISYSTIVGSIEPIYFLVSYLLSYLIDYNTFIFILNFIFLLSLFYVFKYFFTKYYLIFNIFLLTNFYLYIFLTNTHRLKIAFIFFILFLIVKKYKLLSIFVAIISHLQVFLFYLYTLLLKFKVSIKYKIKKKSLFNFLVVVILLSLVFIYMFPHIESKIYYHSQKAGVPFSTIILGTVYVLYLILFNQFKILKLFIPLFLLILPITFFIVPDRLNFILYEFIFLIELNQLLNKRYYSIIAVLPVVSYSGFKLINLIIDVTNGVQ